MLDLLFQSLEIMWKGMLAIFLVTAIIFGLLLLLGLIKPRAKKKKSDAPEGESAEQR